MRSQGITVVFKNELLAKELLCPETSWCHDAMILEFYDYYSLISWFYPLPALSYKIRGNSHCLMLLQNKRRTLTYKNSKFFCNKLVTDSLSHLSIFQPSWGIQKPIIAFKYQIPVMAFQIPLMAFKINGVVFCSRVEFSSRV